YMLAPPFRQRMPPAFPSPTRRALRFRELTSSYEPPLAECGSLQVPYTSTLGPAVMFEQQSCGNYVTRMPHTAVNASQRSDFSIDLDCAENATLHANSHLPLQR